MMGPLAHEDRLWIAKKICEVREEVRAASRWQRRLDLFVDGLIWAYSVDGVDGDHVVQDGLVPAGRRLKESHLRHVPCTDLAREALRREVPRSIIREHIVPRAKVREIVRCVITPEDTKRVLDTYARVVLVHEMEADILDSRQMPGDWGAGVDWSKPPGQLPDGWARYRTNEAPIVPKWNDGTCAWDGSDPER